MILLIQVSLEAVIMNTLKLMPQALNAIFNYFKNRPDSFCWLRSPDYQKQLYISEGYTTIWGRPINELYEDPFSWRQNVATDNIKQTAQLIRQQYANHESASWNSVYYRLIKPDGGYHWIKDNGFHLYDNSGQSIAVAGFGEILPETQWLAETKPQTQLIQTVEEHDFLAVIKQELKANKDTLREALFAKSQTPLKYSVRWQDNTIPISKREAQSLYYLLQGKTTKEIANLLHLSPRTVEEYLNHVKLKLDCPKKSVLLSQIQTGDIQVIRQIEDAWPE